MRSSGSRRPRPRFLPEPCRIKGLRFGAKALGLPPQPYRRAPSLKLGAKAAGKIKGLTLQGLGHATAGCL